MDDRLTLRRALTLVEEVVSRAEQTGGKLCVAVFDAGDNLLAFARMDGALLGSIDVAVGKASTSAAFEMTTSELAALVVPGAPLYGLEFARPGVVAVGGGAPLRSGERVVGALGISGGTVPDDTALAESVAASF
jgi:uncharacterized protein GlcG (DUF336 family)